MHILNVSLFKEIFCKKYLENCKVKEKKKKRKSGIDKEENKFTNP
jgi:hypothetical protein